MPSRKRSGVDDLAGVEHVGAARLGPDRQAVGGRERHVRPREWPGGGQREQPAGPPRGSSRRQCADGARERHRLGELGRPVAVVVEEQPEAGGARRRPASARLVVEDEVGAAVLIEVRLAQPPVHRPRAGHRLELQGRGRPRRAPAAVRRTVEEEIGASIGVDGDRRDVPARLDGAAVVAEARRERRADEVAAGAPLVEEHVGAAVGVEVPGRDGPVRGPSDVGVLVARRRGGETEHLHPQSVVRVGGRVVVGEEIASPIVVEVERRDRPPARPQAFPVHEVAVAHRQAREPAAGRRVVQEHVRPSVAVEVDDGGGPAGRPPVTADVGERAVRLPEGLVPVARGRAVEQEIVEPVAVEGGDLEGPAGGHGRGLAGGVERSHARERPPARSCVVEQRVHGTNREARIRRVPAGARHRVQACVELAPRRQGERGRRPARRTGHARVEQVGGAGRGAEDQLVAVGPGNRRSSRWSRSAGRPAGRRARARTRPRSARWRSRRPRGTASRRARRRAR